MKLSLTIFLTFVLSHASATSATYYVNVKVKMTDIKYILNQTVPGFKEGMKLLRCEDDKSNRKMAKVQVLLDLEGNYKPIFKKDAQNTIPGMCNLDETHDLFEKEDLEENECSVYYKRLDNMGKHYNCFHFLHWDGKDWIFSKYEYSRMIYKNPYESTCVHKKRSQMEEEGIDWLEPSLHIALKNVECKITEILRAPYNNKEYQNDRLPKSWTGKRRIPDRNNNLTFELGIKGKFLPLEQLDTHNIQEETQQDMVAVPGSVPNAQRILAHEEAHG